jgi:hypothetical protein
MKNKKNGKRHCEGDSPKQSIETQISGLVTCGAPFGGHSVRNDVLSFLSFYRHRHLSFYHFIFLSKNQIVN